MRIQWIAAILLLVFCQCGQKVSAENVPTPGKTLVIESSEGDSDAVRHTIECFPSEIYFGDTIYIASFAENISKEEIVSVPECLSDMIYWEDKWTISTSTLQIDGDYTPRKELPERQTAIPTIVRNSTRLLPGDKRVLKFVSFELPPLEDMELPFWKEFYEKIPLEGAICNVRINEKFKFECRGNYQYKDVSSEFKILVKPRPLGEKELLDFWRESTPKTYLPCVYKVFKIPLSDKLKSSGRSEIELLGEKYDPWSFIRVGNRKPSDPNNPTTLDGWRKLESSLSPSTMRDEVRLTRLRLEYYAAKDEAEARAAKKAYCDWIESLPEVQRLIMTRYDYCGESNLTGTPLGEKSVVLRNWNAQLNPYRKRW